MAPPPKEGEQVFFCGYPGQETIQTGHLEVNFGLHCGFCPATNVTDHQIKCHFDLTSRVDTIGNGLPPPAYQLGGISGGPLLVPDYDLKEKTWGWRLGGVISEAIATPDYEILTAVRAHFIHPDGRIG